MAIYCTRQNKFVAKLMHLVNKYRGNQIKRLYVFELNHFGWRKKITIVDTKLDIGNNYDS